MKKYLLLLVSIISVIAILLLADFDKVFSSIKTFDRVVLIKVCILQIITIILLNIQWYTISIQIGQKIPFIKIFHVNMVGTFTESVTPSVKAGGEVAKIISLKSVANIPTSKATAIVGVQKVISIFTFLILSIISLILFIIKSPNINIDTKNAIILSGVILTTIFGIIIYLLFNPQKIKCITKLLRKNKIKDKIETGIDNFSKYFRGMIKNKKLLISQTILSVVIWQFFAVKAYLISKGANIEITMIQITAITYITYMVAMIPLLPGGLGSFEATMVLLLSSVGIEPYKGVALSIVLRFITFWFVFLISSIYLFIYQILKWIKVKKIYIK